MEYKKLEQKYDRRYSFEYFPCIEHLIDKEHNWLYSIDRQSLKEGYINQKQLDEKISIYAASSFMTNMPYNPVINMIKNGELSKYVLAAKISDNTADSSKFIEDLLGKEFVYSVEQYIGFWDDYNDKHIVRTFKLDHSTCRPNSYSVRHYSYFI